MRDILNKVGIWVGLLSFGLFMAAEVHAWWVIAPTGVLCENPDFGVMWHMDSMLPMQFRLMSYRAGSGAFWDLGFTIPAMTLGTLVFSVGLHYLQEAMA